jgi:NADH:ubiquinone oxidoreductase subunit 4 (subunit M)
VFFGSLPETIGEIRTIPLRDHLTVVFLSMVMISLGLFPAWIASVIQQALPAMLTLLGGK